MINRDIDCGYILTVRDDKATGTAYIYIYMHEKERRKNGKERKKKKIEKERKKDEPQIAGNAIFYTDMTYFKRFFMSAT